MSDIDYLISRLEEALEKQQATEGENVLTPVVTYCFDCDEITIDNAVVRECLDHHTVSSDGHEHAGIREAITTLNYLQGGDK